MGIMGVLFNPNGRIRANQFWQGIIVLTAYLIIINVAGGFLPAGIAAIFSISVYFLPYPYLCVYGKRLHDSGKTAWLYLLFFIGFLFGFGFIVNSSPGFSEFMALYMEAAADGEEPQIMQAMLAEFLVGDGGRAIALRALGYLVAINLIFGFIAARMPSDPQANQYGAPAGNVGASPDGDDTFS